MIPRLPTDNLYKFLAIAGIVTFLFSGYSVLKQRNLYRAILSATMEEQAVLSAKIGFAKSQLNILEKIIENSLKQKVDPDAFKEEKNRKISMPYDTGEIKELKQKIYDLSLDLEISEARVDSKRRSFGQTARDYKISVRIGLGVMLLGILMSALGFRTWYVLVQKPNDELLMLELKRAFESQVVDYEDQK